MEDAPNKGPEIDSFSSTPAAAAKFLPKLFNLEVFTTTIKGSCEQVMDEQKAKLKAIKKWPIRRM